MDSTYLFKFFSDEATQVNNPMQHQAQPFEFAPAYVFLASDDSRFVIGQTIRVNGEK